MIAAYIDYFRQIAIEHVELRHDPLTERTGGGDINRKAFGRFNAEEIIQGLRNQVGPLAMMIELYSVESNAELITDITNIKDGAFSIIKSAAPGDFDEEEKAYADTEKIMYEVLQRIYADHYGDGVSRCTSPFNRIYLNKCKIDPVGPLFTNYFGWRCLFQFQPKEEIDITAPVAPGIFNKN